MDRQALVTRVMNGAATAINQMSYPAVAGFNREIPPAAYDPARAKRLLAEAGYPSGFGLTVHCSNDRYPNDARICQTVGQMLARIGLDVKVEALPKAVYFGKIFPPTSEYAFGLIGIGDSSGEGSSMLDAVLRTRDPAVKGGMLNAAQYSNPAVDRLTEALKNEFDPQKRAETTRQAMAITARDLPYVPLFSGSVVAASKKSILFEVRVDEMTLAQNAKPAR
jgi:peptide/nickel transport system substrate-binding protein